MEPMSSGGVVVHQLACTTPYGHFASDKKSRLCATSAGCQRFAMAVHESYWNVLWHEFIVPPHLPPNRGPPLEWWSPDLSTY